MNGTIVVLLNSLRFGAYPSVGVNAVWMVIAIIPGTHHLIPALSGSMS
jgi:hypothetical protein